MKPTKIYTLTIPGNGVAELRVAGEYFKVMSATGAVTVRSDWGELEALLPGQGLESTPFKGLLLIDASGATNVVRMLIGDEKFVDGMGGAVVVSQITVAKSAGFATTAPAVTNASAQIVAANAGRQYLLIQNNHSSASIYLNFGAAATVAGCIKIIPGGAYELGAGVVTTQAVNAIGDTANNAAVVIVEG